MGYDGTTSDTDPLAEPTSGTRIIEEYNVTSGDILRIKRPNGAGQMQIAARYVKDYDEFTNVSIFKRDAAGVPLISMFPDFGTFENQWKDRAGLEVGMFSDGSQHVYAPTEIIYRDIRDPNDPNGGRRDPMPRPGEAP